MTLSDILESNNIRSDRYAMTAISNICKAFGYKTYSKESWPWGKDMQFEWQCSKGINTDVLEAELLLEKARTTSLEESNKDNNIYNIISEDPSLISLHNQIKNLLNILNSLKDNLSDANDTSSNISNISENTISKIDDILQIKSEQDAPIALGITTTYPETAIATASGGGGHGTLMWTNGNSLNNVGSKTTKAYWTGNFNYYQSPYSNEIILTVNKGEQAAPIAVGSITTYPTVALASIEDDRGHGTLLWTNGDKLENTTGTISTQAYWTGDSNYKESPKSNTISLTVIKFTPSITLSVNNRLYNGSPLYATAFIEVPEGGKQIKGTIYYGTSEGASTYNVTYNGTPVNLSSVSITNVGAQTVYVYFVPDSTCNDVYNNSESVNKTFNISKAPQNPPIANGDITTTYPWIAAAKASGGGGQGTLIWTNGATLDTVGTKKTRAYWSGNSNYNASLYSNEVTLTVNKFTPVITLSATNRAYNGSPLYATAFIEVPIGGKQIKGTIYFGTSEGASTYNVTYNGTSVNLSSVSITDVGAQTVYAYFVPNSTCNDVYNNSESVSKTFNISKSPGNVTTVPTAKSGLIYNGSVQALINAGSGTGTMYYSLSSNSGFNTSIPTATDVGDYTVYYYAAANTNYNQSATGSISVKIVENYFRLTTLENGTTFNFTNAINYSLDYGATWTSLAANTNTPSLNTNTDILFKGTLTPTSSNGIGKFSSNSKTFNASGNIMSLLYGDDFKNQTSLSGKNYAFYNLFYNSKIVNASNLILPATTLVNECYTSMFSRCTSLTSPPTLPATTLANYCYQNMFYGCSSLITTPELPATTLVSNCYDSMFYNCTSLTTAHELSATTLANYCCFNMFSGCTSLTSAPELPATTLANSCYQGMFQSCTSLTTAPELPATTLVEGCYSYMFYNCSSLNYIKALFTTMPGTSYTDNWIYGVAASGTFVKSSDATWNVTGVNGVPNEWTVEK